ncbi:ricin-type beta-trefoil lectin domain protein [Streptomyces sp. HD1123-B1]|uniref:ricin-type beta-trefoil lectin domain protein n=1 Tax=Streptomyces huangiella TaxID=3228804 RepID=UPI003D7EB002
MSQPDGADGLPPAEGIGPGTSETEADPANIPYASLPDVELTPLMRSAGRAAEYATAEFQGRHLDAVRAYARICCRDAQAAERLTDAVFSRAGQDIGTQPRRREAWRHHLLLLVHRTATAWTATDRYSDVALGFAASCGDTGGHTPGGPGDTPSLEEGSLLLSSFRTLPERTQAVLWHSLVEGDADTRTARLLGLEPQSVLLLRQKALGQCGEVYLHTHVAHAHLAPGGPVQAMGDECWRFSGLLEAEARRSGAHRSRDLVSHLTGCSRCRHVLRELAGLKEHPAVVLAEGLLPWGGAAYLATRHPRHALADPGEPGTRGLHSPGGSAGGATQLVSTVVAAAASARWRVGSTWRTSGRRARATATLAAAIAVVAVATMTVLALPPVRHAAKTKEEAAPTIPPSLDTSPPLAPASPSPSPSASSSAPHSPGAEKHRKRTSPQPKPSPKPKPSSDGGGDTSPPAKNGPAFTQVVNGKNGLCLGARDGRLAAGADITVQTCTDTAVQGWYMSADHLIRSSADPAFCMDSRNDTDTGVGVWPCSEADDRMSDRLRFQTGGDGSIHPFIDVEDSAVRPLGDSAGEGVIFDWSRGYANQHWCVRGPGGLGNLPKC